MDSIQFESLPREELEAVQLQRLQETCLRAFNRVPHYKESFDKIGIKPEDVKSLKDLSSLPFTVKQDMRNNYPFGLFAESMDNVVRIHSSSGTTGKPTVVGYTAEDMNAWNEIMIRVYRMAGLNSSDIMHNAYGYGLFTGGLGFHTAAEQMGMAVVPSSGGLTSRQLMLMKDYGATVLGCTPTFALHLAEVAQKEGYDLKNDFKLRAGIFGAEPVSPGLKEEIEKVWGIQYFETYGLSEIMGPGVSGSCPHSRYLHIAEDHFIPEIIDPETFDPLPYGERGELVFTTITKQAIPLIRYRTKDLTTLHAEPCECGRTLLRMESIVGRSDDMLIIGGVNVFPSQIEHVIAQIEGLSLNYIIIADKKGHLDRLELEVEVAETIEIADDEKMSKLKNELKEGIRNHLYVNANVILVATGTLARSEGKAVRVIDKRSS
ncbi:MAG: phenylacetate--CoA ligase [Deltaproteobacteria bacterium]|nr:phenylacetate--CoA ligase [Deltaproteobacteria bacterium]MBT7154713.1 phenylacetate--CoA ligase [Deltaproteobacteria bacterium]